MTTDKDFDFSAALMQEAGQLASKMLQGTYATEWKPDNTPVTDIDKAINELFLKRIGEKFPNDRFYGEEGSAEGKGGGCTWVADPIDGTQALGILPASTICLARLDTEGKPLFGLALNPATGELFAGRRGEPSTLNGKPIRVSEKSTVKSSYIFLGSRLHLTDLATNGTMYDRLEGQGAKMFNMRSLAFGCLMVACGKAEGAYIGVPTPYEAATVALIVLGAGGTVTDLYGNSPTRYDGEIKGLIVSNGRIHEALVRALNP